MPLLVFDEIERDLSGPCAPTENHFAYLNRSDRAEAGRVRDLVEDWIARYPAAQRPSLVSRLRSPNDPVHLSAFWELAVHELLICTGHAVLEIEPKLAHTTRCPDFLVQAPSGERFYLEAVIATGTSDAEKSEDTRLNSAVHVIEQADSPAHFLDLHVEGKPTHPVTLKTLRRRLKAWIEDLPEGHDAKLVEPFEYDEHGVHFTVRAFARKAPLANSSPAVGVKSSEPTWGTPGDGIREAVEKKASRYGTLDLPYVVAVNSMSNHQGEIDALDALLGSPCVIVKQFKDGHTEYEDSRSPNGVWIGKAGPRKRGVSAVLSTERVDPWSVCQRRARLIRHPWATKPLPPVPLGIDELNPEDGEMKKEVGKSLWELLGLSSSWPEGDG